MAQIFFYGQVLSYEAAQKEGRTKAYVRCFDADTKRTFQFGLTSVIQEESIPQSREKWVVSGVTISDGKTGTYMTADAIQVVRDNPATAPAPSKAAANGG